ncbi:unnamed protein product [marine sediment metagenome]|uniref:Uncharacterized protein n=1 Tax=marine sediment metagenome TaxID=412755 RepID=X0T7F2_9ZZZZ
MPLNFKPYKPKTMGMQDPHKRITKEDVDKSITQHIKKHNQAIHGAKAVNKQITEEFHRPTQDFDVWTKNPQHHQDKMEDELDKLAGTDMFHEETKPLQGHPDIMVYRVVGPRGEVVDYMLPPPGAKTKRIDKIRYETLQYAKKIHKQILADPNIGWARKQKSARDLRRIEAYERSLK